MKILVLSDLYPPYYMGGYELRCKETTDEIAKRGHDISVLTSWWGLKKGRVEGNIYRLLYLNPTIDMLHHDNFHDPFRMHRRINQLKWAFECRQNYRIAHQLIIKKRPDIIFIWNMEHVGINAILSSQGIGIPTIYSLGIDWLIKIKREINNEPDSLKRKLRAFLNGYRNFQALDFRYMISISQMLKHSYVENGFPEKCITVIPRGIPSNIINDNNVPRDNNNIDKIRLLFVGRICPEKAPDDAINAIGILGGKVGNHKIDLDIIGSGQEGYILELRKLVTSLKLESHVNFLGQLEHRAILDLFPCYDALLFPSRWEEPLGVVVLESMARGVPVIATDRGGIPEMVIDGMNGLLIPANSPEKMAEAINRLFLEDGFAQRLRIAGLKTVREQFTLERIVDRLMNYFETVLASQA